MEDRPKISGEIQSVQTERFRQLTLQTEVMAKVAKEKPDEDRTTTTYEQKMASLRRLVGYKAELKLMLEESKKFVEAANANYDKALASGMIQASLHSEESPKEMPKKRKPRKKKSTQQKTADLSIAIMDKCPRDGDTYFMILLPQDKGKSGGAAGEETVKKVHPSKAGPSNVKETEDDLRLKALFAQMDGQMAQNESLRMYAAQVPAQHGALLHKIDAMKAQSALDAQN